jgi:hypothetical protein
MGLNNELFGKNETTKRDSSGSQFTTFRPQDEATLTAQRNSLEGLGNLQNQQLFNLSQQQLQSRAPQLGTNFGQFNANLNTNFQGPQFSQTLDPTSQNILAQELGNRQAQLQRQQQGIQQQFGGRNNQLAQILQSQAGAQSQLANNPLAFQALQQQGGREAQNYQLGQQAQQLGNQALLSQQGFNAGLQGQGNQALAQQFGLNAQNFQNQAGALGAANAFQSNLLNQLAQLAQLRGIQSNISAENQNVTQAGLLENAGNLAKSTPFTTKA